MELHSKVSHQVGVFNAFENLQLVCGLFDGFVIVRLEADLDDGVWMSGPTFSFSSVTKDNQHTSFIAISSPVSTLMQVYTFPYWPSPVPKSPEMNHHICIHAPFISKPSVCSYTYFVAPLPLEGHFPQPDMHDVVIRLGCVTHLADDVALLHHGIALFLQLADRTSDGLQGTLPGCCV